MAPPSPGVVDAAVVAGEGFALPADPTPAEQQRWVRAARAGDPRGFERLHAVYGPVVHGLLLARVPPGEAEDLVQDVFLKAWLEIPRLRDPGAFGPWLCRIARNRATDWYRRRRRPAPLPELAVEAPPRAEALEALAAIRALPRRYRETLLLRLVEGLDGAQIAERTGLTPGSVRVNLHRGLKRLRAALGRKEGP